MELGVDLTADDVSSIRQAIRAWGKPPEVAVKYGTASLGEHLSAWKEFVERDWGDWDISEYDHDVGCRTWIQVAVEHSNPATAAQIEAAAKAADSIFRSLMVPARELPSYRVPVLRQHPYFWETHTIHPELAAGAA